tara:strand:+ start:434 stop:778 length:345 start_codon:yes stop_codon:yes gene_type:complete
MGYRSKVIIGVKNGELSDGLDGIMQKYDFNTNDNATDYLKIHTENDGMKFYTFEYTKWYESDDWCRDIMEYIHKVSEDNDNAFCVGLGEDGQTHSEIGLYWEYVEQISEINLID